MQYQIFNKGDKDPIMIGGDFWHDLETIPKSFFNFNFYEFKDENGANFEKDKRECTQFNL